MRKTTKDTADNRICRVTGPFDCHTGQSLHLDPPVFPHLFKRYVMECYFRISITVMIA